MSHGPEATGVQRAELWRLTETAKAENRYLIVYFKMRAPAPK